jgi:hypothetical protein
VHALSAPCIFSVTKASVRFLFTSACEPAVYNTWTLKIEAGRGLSLFYVSYDFEYCSSPPFSPSDRITIRRVVVFRARGSILLELYRAANTTTTTVVTKAPLVVHFHHLIVFPIERTNTSRRENRYVSALVLMPVQRAHARVRLVCQILLRRRCRSADGGLTQRGPRVSTKNNVNVSCRRPAPRFEMKQAGLSVRASSWPLLASLQLSALIGPGFGATNATRSRAGGHETGLALPVLQCPGRDRGCGGRALAHEVPHFSSQAAFVLC